MPQTTIYAFRLLVFTSVSQSSTGARPFSVAKNLGMALLIALVHLPSVNRDVDVALLYRTSLLYESMS